MVRIRGSIGDWPVDLTLELDAEDWRQLAQHLPPPPPGEPQAAAARTPVAEAPQDRLWQAAIDLLRGSGRIEGPQLLAELQAFTGNAGAAKHLLVRLRHNARVRVEVVDGTQVFVWQEE
ncbi:MULTISPECIES: hypothetical protein [Pseudomonas aeruginosa group]|uniref:hypothetical protein n=1 Tax=Pseudomonas aeruginosa group TaxID=136841 RepID=UPI00053EA495|nr:MULTISPECIES: hypothetical protein [Pseudomonas aeruginosa group]VTS37793.1 Uncharacterised protein [Streptococcus dysgalactiae subsp. equisimilis]AVR66255.1 hypothetical protein B7D75_04400 [Pseudomonas paraeruginosa]KAB0741643.1 hypothetical protein F7O94_25250 [Pseudomonas aeruginosa]KRU84247.1 hypothetical protein AN454_06540 [Pseudomonas aeruginosa]KSR48459.1 hypothetical protein APB45_05180 [Pseudomonas aeruginosa]